MINNRKILAIIPARGGSKGVKLKNIHPLMGIPLIGHVGNLIKEISLVDRAVVSTDSKAIAEVAAAYGLAVPFYRPEEISGDRIGDWDVLNHALKEMEKIDKTLYDYVVMLQPTSPLRKPLHVINAIEKLDREGLDPVWTVSPVDLKYHPLKQLTVLNNQLELFDKRGSAIIARQQLSPTYYRNGACYAITRDCIINKKSILGDKAGAIIIDESLISIDTVEDFNKTEALFLSTNKSGPLK